jgi:hypothetical protein
MESSCNINPPKRPRSTCYNVYLHGKLIDSVYATGYDCESMRRSLIDHDGYDGVL